MITGRQVWKSRIGGHIEIYENDRFVGNLEYKSALPVGLICFTTPQGKSKILEVGTEKWLNESLDYRQDVISKFIESLIHQTSCPMTP